MQSSVYNPYFTPMQYSPALWLDASDASTLVMDGARTFNGSSQYFSLASNSTIQAQDSDLWFSVWVKNTVESGVNPYISKRAATFSTTLEYLLNYTNVSDRFQFILGDGASPVGVVADTFGAPTTNTWYFLFACFDASANKIKISVNGGAFDEASFTATPLVSTNALTMGVLYSGGSNYHSGSMDSVCMGKPATAGWLTSNATALRDYLYNSGSGRRSSDFLASSYYTGGNPSGAVSWWDMDARSGNETDRIGSNTLVDNGGVGYAAGVASGLVQYTGDPVKQWSDKSGNARHVTAASNAGRPTYTTAVQNGLPAIAYDGVDDALIIANAMGLTTTSGLTMFSVVKNVSGAPSNETFYGLNGRIAAAGRSSGTTNQYFGTSATNAGTATGSANFQVLTHMLDYSGSDNASRLKVWHDGVAQSLSFSGTVGASNAAITNFAVGSRAVDGTPAYGEVQVCELLLFSGAASFRNLVERYLGNKWGIAVA